MPGGRGQAWRVGEAVLKRVDVPLAQLGWQGTFWSLGAVGGGLILSLTVFFRNRPADLGLMPYGATAADPPFYPDKTKLLVWRDADGQEHPVHPVHASLPTAAGSSATGSATAGSRVAVVVNDPDSRVFAAKPA